MKTFTSVLSVNRLITSLLTFTLLLTAGHAVAETGIQDKLNDNNNIYSGIEYASLVAGANEKSVFINWVTASEQNNSHFEVERSTDMKNFKTVAMVLDGFAAAGTGKTYRFKEDAGDVRNGKTVYYRLKQIGTDNQVHYSSVMAVQMNSTVTIYPEPAVSGLNSADQYPGASVFANVQISKETSPFLLSKQSFYRALP